MRNNAETYPGAVICDNYTGLRDYLYLIILTVSVICFDDIALRSSSVRVGPMRRIFVFGFGLLIGLIRIHFDLCDRIIQKLYDVISTHLDVPLRNKARVEQKHVYAEMDTPVT